MRRKKKAQKMGMDKGTPTRNEEVAYFNFAGDVNGVCDTGSVTILHNSVIGEDECKNCKRIIPWAGSCVCGVSCLTVNIPSCFYCGKGVPSLAVGCECRSNSEVNRVGVMTQGVGASTLINQGIDNETSSCVVHGDTNSSFFPSTSANILVEQFRVEEGVTVFNPQSFTQPAVSTEPVLRCTRKTIEKSHEGRVTEETLELYATQTGYAIPQLEDEQLQAITDFVSSSPLLQSEVSPYASLSYTVNSTTTEVPGGSIRLSPSFFITPDGEVCEFNSNEECLHLGPGAFHYISLLIDYKKQGLGVGEKTYMRLKKNEDSVWQTAKNYKSRINKYCKEKDGEVIGRSKRNNGHILMYTF